ncbi:hypothetical protein P3T35_000505 [Kitasatospora sp. GP30]|nr:hypothetical protein [Kitasatospora sp. GP30]
MTPSATNLSTSPPRGTATATPPPRSRQPRDADAVTANLVVGVLGIAAFAVSFTHVVQTSTRAGQTGWVAFAIAVSVELMALGSVSEIRRRRRYRQPDLWPRCVLALGIVMSLAANLAVAQSTPWGYVMAAWPSLAFGAAAGIIESRPASPSNAVPEPPGADPEHEYPQLGTAEVEALVTESDDDTEPVEPEPESEPDAEGGAGPDADPADQGAEPEDEEDEQDEPAEPAELPSPQDRPSRARVLTELLAEMRADPAWAPDYPELQRTTGYSRSWCEKRVSEARTLCRRPDPAAAEPPADRAGTQPNLTAIHTPRDPDDDQPVPPNAQPAPNPYEEPAREHHPPHTAAAA